MKYLSTLTILLFIVMTTASHAKQSIPKSFTHIETVVNKTEEDKQFQIPYQKYRLNNGLTVILHEDNSTDKVRVEMTYRVGSGHEPLGRKGIAHFLEHMMFRQTEHTQDKYIKALLQEISSSNVDSGVHSNAFTNKDITRYHTEAYYKNLERILWIESERMGFALDGLTDEAVEIERQVVRNERFQMVESDPKAMRTERIYEALYPIDHPYHAPVIGYQADIASITTSELRQFYSKYYIPNNAVLVIGGKINPQQTLKLIAKYFKDIPSGLDLETLKVKPTILENDKFASMQWTSTYSSMSYTYFIHTELLNEKKALKLLSRLLKFEENNVWSYQQALSSNTTSTSSFRCLKNNCKFDISLAPFDRNSLDNLFDSFEKFEISNKDMDNLYNIYQGNTMARILKSLDKSNTMIDIIAGGIDNLDFKKKVSLLSDFEVNQNSPLQINNAIIRFDDKTQQLLNISKDDLWAVYNRYLKDKPKLVFTTIPKQDNWFKALFSFKPFHKDNWQPPVRPPQLASVFIAGENTHKETPETFNRMAIPKAHQIQQSLSNDYMPKWRAELQNGIIVYGYDSPSKEDMGISTLFFSMPIFDRLGVTEKNHSTDKIEGSIICYSGNCFFGVSSSNDDLIQLNKKAQKSLKNLENKFKKFNISKIELKKMKKNKLIVIENEKNNTSVVAYLMLNRLLFPNNKNNFTEIKNSIKDIDINGIQKDIRSSYSANHALIIVYSNRKKDELVQSLSTFQQIPKTNTIEINSLTKPYIQKQLYFIDHSNANQAQIMFGKRAFKFDTTGKFFRSGLMIESLSNRLYHEIRVKKGSTYTPNSELDDELFTVSLAANYQDIDETIASTLDILNNLHNNGLSQQEIQNTVRNYDFPKVDPITYQDFVERFKQPKNYPAIQKQIIANLSKADLDPVAKELFDTEDMIIVVVGQRQKLEKDLKKLARKLDIPYTELDYDGNPVK